MTDYYIDADGVHVLGDPMTLLGAVMDEDAKLNKTLKAIYLLRDAGEYTTREAVEATVSALDEHQAACRAAREDFTEVRT